MPSPQQSHDIWLEKPAEDSKDLVAALLKAGLDKSLVAETFDRGRGQLVREVLAGRSIALERLLKDAGAKVRIESYDRFVYLFRNVNQPFEFWAADGRGEAPAPAVQEKPGRTERSTPSVPISPRTAGGAARAACVTV